MLLALLALLRPPSTLLFFIIETGRRTCGTFRSRLKVMPVTH
jgi:hypothetical protein